MALPLAMKTILDIIDAHPRGWPLRRKDIGGVTVEFHLAIVSIAYRQLHLRYFVDNADNAHLLAIWVDGQDEPDYRLET